MERLQPARTGFASYAQPKYGFAQYMGPETSARPVAEKPKPTPRAKRWNATKPNRETYPWPYVDVSSRINMPEAGKHWRSFEKPLEQRARMIGRSVGIRNFRVEIISHEEFSNALNEKCSSAAADPDPKRRNRIVRHYVEGINDIIDGFAREEHEHVLTAVYGESPDLKERLNNPDEPKWFAEMLEDKDAVMEPTQLWTPKIFEVGTQEGIGPNGIGVTLEDAGSVFVSRKRALVPAICKELGLNSEHFVSLEQPAVKMVDTSPLPVDGLQFRLPPMHPDIALKAPHAYANK